MRAAIAALMLAMAPSALCLVAPRVPGVLRLRGGEVAEPAATTLAPSRPLKVVAGRPMQTQRRVPLVHLPQPELEALQLQTGQQVKLSKVKKSPFWAPSPNELVAEVAEEPETSESSVRVPAEVMQAIGLRAGDPVLATKAEVAVAGEPAAGQREVYRRRRYNPWMRVLLYQTMFGGRGYGYGYGGYGYGRGYGYGHGGRRGYGYGQRRGYAYGGRKRR